MPTLFIEATSLIRTNQNNHNSIVYIDMMHDMLQKRDGVFTATLRIAGGYITDYVRMESDDSPGPPAIHRQSKR